MPENKKPLPVLAVDVGGTKMIVALVSQSGEILDREYSLTYADDGPQMVIDRILSAVDGMMKTAQIATSGLHSISLAIAGAIDAANGVVTLSPSLPGWHDVALRDMVQKKFGIRTFLVNDANAAALGEHRFGAGKGVKNLIYVTVSTGIGSGIIIDGRLYSGVSGGAGEVGHMTVDADGPRCTCGNTGCLEMLASGKAVAREAVRRLKMGDESVLPEMVAGRLEEITAEKVGQAARNGDQLALEVVATAAMYLGIGLVNLVNLFNPEMIIIGGGLAKMGDLLLEPARQLVRERAFPLLSRAVRIVSAQLGDNAGVFGAAVFAWEGADN